MRRLIVQLPRCARTNRLPSQALHRSTAHSFQLAPILSTPSSRCLTSSLAHRNNKAPIESTEPKSEWWATLIGDEGGGPDDVGIKTYRCTYSHYSHLHWNEFVKAFEKLVLKDWEERASKGSDPDGMRHHFKIFWEEDREIAIGDRGLGDEDLMFLRTKFDRYSKIMFHDQSTGMRPLLKCFFLVNDEVIKSLLNPNEGVPPFVWAVEASDSDETATDANWEDDYQYYQVDIDLIGRFWLFLGPLDRSFEVLDPETTSDGINWFRKFASMQ